ncbi:craniofacial development protein 2-like [Macrobrachium rosenbergii]|uniref:craniofacial development protein 2-like n=1 Tax=Macrobrachium rosenbergii TaxID=79674 RepID=UPI0034D613E4
MRRPGEKIQMFKSGYLLYNSGKESKQNGVGFLINENLQSNNEKFTATSDRVIGVTLRISKRYRLTIIQVYAPTSVSSQEELDNFYDDLYTTLNNNKTHYNMIIGDFNAKIGQGNGDCVCKLGYGERNERGDDLINFAVAHDFKIMNTFFQKSESKRWTLRSSIHETRNEIDYILVDKHNIVKSVDVLNQVNVGSDHRMVRCKIQMNIKQERQKIFFSRPEHIKIPEALKSIFQIELPDRYEILENLEDQNINENDLENLNNNIIIPLKVVAKKFQDRKPSETSKFSEETKNLTKKRRNFKPPSTVREKIEAAELNKTLQKKQRQDLRNRTAEIIEAIKRGSEFKTAKRKLFQGIPYNQP